MGDSYEHQQCLEENRYVNGISYSNGKQIVEAFRTLKAEKVFQEWQY